MPAWGRGGIIFIYFLEVRARKYAFPRRGYLGRGLTGLV
ncbi:hypothetical protein DFAR_1750018 [Desulfarculales bacterium]